MLAESDRNSNRSAISSTWSGFHQQKSHAEDKRECGGINQFKAPGGEYQDEDCEAGEPDD